MAERVLLGMPSLDRFVCETDNATHVKPTPRGGLGVLGSTGEYWGVLGSAALTWECYNGRFHNITTKPSLLRRLDRNRQLLCITSATRLEGQPKTFVFKIEGEAEGMRKKNRRPFIFSSMCSSIYVSEFFFPFLHLHLQF